MSDTQLRDQAVAHLKQTTVAWAKYEQLRRAGKYPNGGTDTYWGRAFSALNAVQEPGNITLRNAAGEELKATTVGYRNKYWTTPPAGTHWAKALEFISQIKDTAAPPGPDQRLGQSWIFMAQSPEKALIYPSYYGIAFTADGAYEKPSAGLIQTLRGRGQRVRSWCDCHSTFPDTAKQMARELELDGWIGEGESAGAFDVAVQGDAKVIIGNLSALTADQKELIRDGRVLWINELYANQDPSLPSRENWQNLPVASRCIASYDAISENPNGRYFPVSEYLSLRKFRANVDCFYDPGAHDDDRRMLP